MTALDPIFVDASQIGFDLDGRACTIRRPHTLKRFDGALVASLVFKVAGDEEDTSVTLELSDSERLTGRLPAGIVLTIAGADCTVATTATADDDEIAVTLATGLVADAAIGVAVTVPAEASWAGSSTTAPRYFEETAGANSFSGLPVGTRITVVERWSDSIELQGGTNHGDYFDDEGGNNLGRFTQIIDASPEDFEGVVS